MTEIKSSLQVVNRRFEKGDGRSIKFEKRPIKIIKSGYEREKMNEENE